MNGRLLFPFLGSTLLQPTNASQEYSTTTVRGKGERRTKPEMNLAEWEEEELEGELPYY